MYEDKRPQFGLPNTLTTNFHSVFYIYLNIWVTVEEKSHVGSNKMTSRCDTLKSHVKNNNNVSQ